MHSVVRRRLTFRRGTAALAGVACLLAAGCSSSGSDTGGSTSGGKHRFTVAYVPGVTQNPYFSTITRAMQKVTEANDISFIYQGSPNFDAADETQVLNAVLVKKPDLLIVSPVDPVALRAPVQRFLNAGIPVITTDGVLDNGKGIVSAIHGDNVQGGRLAGAAMAKLTKGKGTVAIINIAAGVPVLEDRITGFTSALKAAAPDIKLAPVTEGGGNASGSQSATRSLLLAYPDLSGIYGVTEVNAEGASAALAAVGKKGKIPIVGYDATPQEVKYLKDGSVQFLVAQQAKKEGTIAMQYALDYLTGDKSKIKPLVTLPTVGIDLQNLDTPAVKDALYGPAIN